MFARAGVLCALLFVLAGAGALADSRSLLLADRATQSVGDVDFSQLPIWHSIFKCGEHLTTDSCRLQKMTENPVGTARAEIIGTALRLAVQIDRGRADTADGFASLRAAQAYLIAASFEAETNRLTESRFHFQLALDRAGEVPQKIAKFDQTYSVASNSGSATGGRGSSIPGVTIGGPASHVVMGTRAGEEPVKCYGEAQLVREFATRSLAAIEAGTPLFAAPLEPSLRFSR
jgi:hypothetical protein